jgi:hypothetical protein
MVKRTQQARVIEDDPPVELNISPDKVCYIILKAREFDVKVAPSGEKPASNSADDGGREILEGYADDPTFAELWASIDTLNDEEVIDLIALAWLGRGDFTAPEWNEARLLANQRHRQHSASYLVGIPMLGDYLEEGLAMLGHSCEDYEADRL